MKNLKIKNYNRSVLEHATLITRGSCFFDTYDLNNGYIFKKLKDDDDLDFLEILEYDTFIKDILIKLQLSQEIDCESIIKPDSIYMLKDFFIGYTVAKVDGVSLDDTLSESSDLDSISSLIIKLSEEVRKANKEGVNFPDLGNASNVMIERGTGKIKFIDYDGLQVFDQPSYSISNLISPSTNPYFDSVKYRSKKTGIVESNLDKATLYALFLYYSTKTLMSRFKHGDYVVSGRKISIKDEAIDRYCSEIGVIDTSMQEDIHTIYSPRTNNYPDTSIKRLVRDYRLEKKGDTNTFIKK